jgi:hypothetical protein
MPEGHKEMATYKEIQAWVKEQYDFVPQSCWIAQVKETHGLPTKKAPNRKGANRVKPCPPEKIKAIEAAFRYFGMMK